MSELSDYKRLVEAPAVRSYEATITSLRAEVEKLKAERDELHTEAKLIEESHADDQRMIDRIADIIGLPQDQELHTFAFELWSSEQTSEITRLTSLLEQAEMVIAPFAEMLNQKHPPEYADDRHAWGFDSKVVMWGDFNRASQWIKDRQAKGEG